MSKETPLLSPLKAIALLITYAGCILSAGCCSAPCNLVTAKDGRQICIPKCAPIVQYSGHSFKISGAEIPLPAGGTTISVKGVEWDAKQLQQAAPLIQLLDDQRVENCETLNRAAATLDYADYLKLLSQVEESREKLQQLAVLVTSNDPNGVRKWIETYVPNAGAGAFRPRGRHQLLPEARIPNVPPVPFSSLVK